LKPSLHIGRTIQHAKRLREILGVLAGYGFHNVIEELNLDRLVARGLKVVGRRPSEETQRLPRQVRLRQAMEELGPTFIKLGQILSVRPDLVPAEWAEEFTKLQDDVAPVSFHDIHALLVTELGEKLETELKEIEEEPMATASIAQVHRARLASGERVVLKVMRPGIRGILSADLDIMRALASFVEGHFADLGYSPVEVVREFDRELRRELDLRQEARATERLRTHFKDDPLVGFPRVFHSTTTASVLTLEEIDGTPLSRIDLEALGTAKRRAIVAAGADAVFRQCLEIGFFHADPHPGNIIVRPDGRIVFIDCGMTGHIDPETKGYLADLVLAVVDADLDRVLEVALALADADPAMMDDRDVRSDAWALISSVDTGDLGSLDIGELLRRFVDTLRRHHLQCPADLVFLIKALTTIEAVGAKVDPSFDFVGHARPHLEQLIRRRYGLGALRQRLRESMLGYGQLLERIPAHLRSILFAIRRNRVTINLEHRGLDRLTETIDHASNTIAHAVVVASLIMGSSVLVLADAAAGKRGMFTIFAIAGFVAAVGLLLARFIASRVRS
jgi:ubiquinone biosynthesis protein